MRRRVLFIPMNVKTWYNMTGIEYISLQLKRQREPEMNNKPGFWDFYRAYRQSKLKEDLLYIYEKKRGKLALYKKPVYDIRRKWNLFTVIPAMVLPISLLIYSFFY
jgi:hypothetical protein